MSESTKRISLPEVRDALQRSGYLLESRLASILEHERWLPQPNAVYSDPQTRESRELDIHAFGIYRSGPHPLDLLLPVLLIECVNNPYPIVFIQAAVDPDFVYLHASNIRFVGEPTSILTEGPQGSWTPIAAFLELGEYHHYTRGPFATQYCSFQPKKGSKPVEWFATHRDEDHQAFVKLCDAADYESAAFAQKLKRKVAPGVWLSPIYPVLVVQGELFLAIPTDQSVELVETGHVQFRRRTVQGTTESIYQIDVVTESHFQGFMTSLDVEAREMARRLGESPEQMQRSSQALRAQSDAPKAQGGLA
jgi:hypothetical protein